MATCVRCKCDVLCTVRPDPRRLSVCRGEVGRSCLVLVEDKYARTVENVAELGADVEACPFPDAEGAADPDVFLRYSRIAVVAVVRSAGSKLAGSRICPCIRIQNEFFVRIEAMAVEIFQEQWLSGN